MGELLRIQKWAENLEEVTVGRWLKAEGDEIHEGEPVCEIITEKVTFEYESPTSGVLRKIYAPEKSVIPVGYAIAFIGTPDEPLPAGVEQDNQRLLEQHLSQPRLELDIQPNADTPPPGRGRVRAVPAARKLARQHGISLTDVAQWLGEDRPISPEDVAEYLRRRGISQ